MKYISQLILKDIKKHLISLTTQEKSYNCDIDTTHCFNILFINYIIKKWDDEWLIFEYGITIEDDHILITDIHGHRSILLSDPESYSKVAAIIQGMQCLKT